MVNALRTALVGYIDYKHLFEGAPDSGPLHLKIHPKKNGYVNKLSVLS